MTIRKQPTDFCVREVLSEQWLAGVLPEFEPTAGYAVYRLNKTSMTTPEALSRLGKALGVKAGAIEYAGLKDKHAQTSQHMTVKMVDAAAASKLPKQIQAQGFSASLMGYAAEHIAAAAIDRNHFTIVVRDLSKQASAEIERRADLLAIDADELNFGALLIVNYFGDQRFGSARHKKGWVARSLIAGDFENALRLAIGTPARKDTGKTRTFTRMLASSWGEWGRLAQELPACPERGAIEELARSGDFRAAFTCLPAFLQQIYVEAYQSHLWNDGARRIAHRLGESQRSGAAILSKRTANSALMRSTDAFGDLIFPAAGIVTAEFRDARMPVLGKSTELVEPWGWAAREALAGEGVEQSGLQIPGLRRPFFGQAERSLFVVARHVRISPEEQDDLASSRHRAKRTIEFDLPRGSYATVVLRALGQ